MAFEANMFLYGATFNVTLDAPTALAYSPNTPINNTDVASCAIISRDGHVNVALYNSVVASLSATTLTVTLSADEYRALVDAIYSRPFFSPLSLFINGTATPFSYHCLVA